MPIKLLFDNEAGTSQRSSHLRAWWRRKALARYPSLEGIPGPAPRFGVGNLGPLLKFPPGELSEAIEAKYGPFAVYWALHQPIVWVHDADTIAEILGDRSSSFFKDEPTQAMRPVVAGANAFVSNGAEWQNIRAQNFLAQEGVEAWLHENYAASASFLHQRLSADLQSGKRDDFDRWLYRLVFDFTSVQLLGRTLGEPTFLAYCKIMDAIDWRIRTNLNVLPPGFSHARKVWLDAVVRAFESARSEKHGHSLAHRLAPHSRMLISEQAGAIANLFPGGVFSVTATMLRLLGRNDQLEPLRSTLASNAANYSDLLANQTLEMYLRENMRVDPPVPVFMRRVRSLPVNLRKISLDAGTRVIIGISGVQRSAEHWPDPLTFLPERWTSERLATHPFGSDFFFPFGRGPRACQGQQLALLQIRLLAQAFLGGGAKTLNLSSPATIRFYWGCNLPTAIRATIG
jgi:cytochrome P450